MLSRTLPLSLVWKFTFWELTLTYIYTFLLFWKFHHIFTDLCQFFLCFPFFVKRWSFLIYFVNLLVYCGTRIRIDFKLIEIIFWWRWLIMWIQPIDMRFPLTFTKFFVPHLLFENFLQVWYIINYKQVRINLLWYSSRWFFWLSS